MARPKKKNVNAEYTSEERQEAAMEFLKVYRKDVENELARKTTVAQYKTRHEEFKTEMNRLEHIVKYGRDPVTDPNQTALNYGSEDTELEEEVM